MQLHNDVRALIFELSNVGLARPEPIHDHAYPSVVVVGTLSVITEYYTYLTKSQTAIPLL